MCLRNQVSRTAAEYVSVAPGQDQTLSTGWPRQFLADDILTHTLYCYNHKAASSTWMTVFVNLNPDPGIWDAIDRKTYRQVLNCK